MARRVPECVGILECLGNCSGFLGNVTGRTGLSGCSGGRVPRILEVCVSHRLMLLSGWSTEVGNLKVMKEFVAFVGRLFHVGT